MTNLRPGHGERMLRRAVEKAKHRPESAMFGMPVVRLNLSQAEHLLREIEALRESLQWQPIETAPKDGTPFLAYIRKDWIEGMYADVEGEFCYLSDGDPLTFGRTRPTHWMPLPEAPSDDAVTCELLSNTEQFEADDE